MIRFGTLGTANITPRALIYPCIDEPDAMVRVVGARDRKRAEAFAFHHRIPTVVDAYEDVVTHEKVDAVYVPLHIPAHHQWTIRALEAGKHVLCEKSLACNAAEAREMADAARKADRVLMEAYHYRYHPLFLRAREIYRSGILGDIVRMDAAFHIPATDPTNIRMIYATGGGVTMDIGCYPISWVRHISASEPEVESVEVEVGPPHVDTMLKTRMRFPGGIEATTSGDMRATARFTAYLTVEGSKATMRVVNPLVPQNGHELLLEADGTTRREVFDRRSTYGYQLDAFIDAVENGAPLLTGPEDAVAQMQVIDACYDAAGLPRRGLALQTTQADTP